jgi:hypothetical protein
MDSVGHKLNKIVLLILPFSLYFINFQQYKGCQKSNKWGPVLFSWPVTKLVMWYFRWYRFQVTRIYVQSCKDFWQDNCCSASKWSKSVVCYKQCDVIRISFCQERICRKHPQISLHCLLNCCGPQNTIGDHCKKECWLPKQEKQSAMICLLRLSCQSCYPWGAATCWCLT